jgi:hypothetical protein
VLERTSNDYLGLHNLTTLDTLDRKLACFTRYSKQPSDYYDCFREVEGQTLNEANSLLNDYNMIEEEYKLCSEGCKQLAGDDLNACNSKCGQTFSGSIKALYDNFYKKRVGARKEYKKAKK